jgi:hypothetical protein
LTTALISTRPRNLSVRDTIRNLISVTAGSGQIFDKAFAAPAGLAAWNFGCSAAIAIPAVNSAPSAGAATRTAYAHPLSLLPFMTTSSFHNKPREILTGSTEFRSLSALSVATPVF